MNVTLFHVYATFAPMTASSSALRQERAAVADVCRRLGAEGLLIGTAGNVSVRVEDRVAVTATGAVLAELTPDQVTVVDLDGEVVAGSLRPTSELELHLGVYRRYGTGAVVHTHAPMATAVSCVLDELPCIHYQLLALGGTVRVAPYATFGTPNSPSRYSPRSTAEAPPCWRTTAPSPTGRPSTRPSRTRCCSNGPAVSTSARPPWAAPASSTSSSNSP